MNEELRQTARERLKKEKIKQKELLNMALLSREEMTKVVEDLMIHQMELEIQNENLSNLHLELEKSRNKFLTLYENAPTGYISFNLNGIVREINRAAVRLFGKNKSEVISKPFTLFIHRKSHDVFFNSLKRAKETGLKIKEALLTKNNKTIIFEVFYLNDSEEEQYLSALTDISQLKETEKELQKARKKADAANHAKSLFLANMSHEIRNPLNEILGAIELIEAEEKNPDQLKLFEIVKTSSDMLIDLLDDLLDISKIEAGKLILNKTNFDLPGLVQKISALYRISCEKKNIELIVTNHLDEPFIVNSDKKRIRQILNNLLSNAVKFTETGTIKIELSKGEAAETVNITVSDSGIGIKKEEVHKLFSDFYRSEKNISENQTGTGLGLSITRKLIRLLKGTITVSSDFGKGSVFRVTLPLRKIDCEQQLPMTQRSEVAFKNLSVLVVDDNPINQTIFRKMIENLGCRVEVAGNGRTVLQMLENEKKFFDMIFMDIQMPDMDGFELTKRIRKFQEDRIEKSKVIAVSGHATEFHREQAFESGMNDYLTKPVKSTKIVSVFCRHILNPQRRD